MTTIPANLGPAHFPHYSFYPTKNTLRRHGPRNNPAESFGNETWVGLLTVGLTARDESTTYEIDDVIDIVKTVRTSQTGNPGASFISQRGVYQHKTGKKQVVEEESVRVLIYLEGDETPEEFQKNLVTLGETICKDLNQESIILETQLNGVTRFAGKVWSE